jgi:hypothetical protein
MDEPLLSLGGGIWCNLSEKQGQNLTDEQEALFSLLLGIEIMHIYLYLILPPF